MTLVPTRGTRAFGSRYSKAAARLLKKWEQGLGDSGKSPSTGGDTSRK